MKFIKIVLALMITAVLAYGGWMYFAGPLKDRRDFRQLGASISSCTPFSQTVRKAPNGERLTNDVEGLTDDGRCKFEFQTAGNEKIYCTVPLADVAPIGQAYASFADNISLSGSMRISYNSEKPDPFNDAMNSPLCVVR